MGVLEVCLVGVAIALAGVAVAGVAVAGVAVVGVAVAGVAAARGVIPPVRNAQMSELLLIHVVGPNFDRKRLLGISTCPKARKGEGGRPTC